MVKLKIDYYFENGGFTYDEENYYCFYGFSNKSVSNTGNGGDNVFGAGVYEVGKDIKAASFKLICYEGTELTDVFIYENEDAMTSNEPIFRDYLNYDDKKTSQESCVINLKDGQILKTTGTLLIEDASTAFWAPEE